MFPPRLGGDHLKTRRAKSRALRRRLFSALCLLPSAFLRSVVLLLQLLLEHLARRVARQLLHEDHFARRLEAAQVGHSPLLDLVLARLRAILYDEHLEPQAELLGVDADNRALL